MSSSIEPSRRTHWKRALIALIGVCALIPPLLVLYFLYLFDWNRAREPLSSAASSQTGRNIAIQGELRPDWGWPITRLSASGITIGNVAGGSAPEMVELERIDIAIDLGSLFAGVVEFTELKLTRPRLLLEKNAEGAANWRFLDNPPGGFALWFLPDTRGEFPIIGRLSIVDGWIRYRDPANDTDVTLNAATVEGQADDDAETIRFAGEGVFQAEPFRFELTGADVETLRDSDVRYPLTASIVAGDTSADLEGTVIDPLQLTGLDVEVRVKGANAADLFPLTGIAFPPTPPYEVTGQLDFVDGLWTFSDFAGRMGGSDLAGNLSWDVRPARPLLTGKVSSQKLAIADLGGFIGAEPDVASARVLPDVPLDISRLAAMDAQVEFRGLSVTATRLPVDDFYAKLDLEDRLLRILPVRFGSGQGDITMWMTIDARQEPVRITSKMEVRRVPIAGLFATASVALGKANLAEGYIGGTADLAGTGSSLRDMFASAGGNIGFGMDGGQLSQLMVELIGLDIAESVGFLLAGDEPVAIRCVIADFAVEDGLMTPRAFVIDTDDTLVTGTGSINLKDEVVDLELVPQPKDFSPLTLRMPLDVTGTLADLDFSVKPAGMLARGAAAVALLFVFPPAAIAAFVDFGPGEDSQCVGLLAAMARSSDDAPKNARLVPTNE